MAGSKVSFTPALAGAGFMALLFDYCYMMHTIGISEILYLPLFVKGERDFARGRGSLRNRAVGWKGWFRITYTEWYMYVSEQLPGEQTSYQAPETNTDSITLAIYQHNTQLYLASIGLICNYIQ